MEEDYSSYDPQVTNALWQQYYANSPETTPMGFQFNENQAMANALYNYGQDPYLSPISYMPGYEDTLTRKLLEKNAAGTTTQTQAKSQSSMPNMNMMQGLMGGSGFAPSSAAATPGTSSMDFSSGFGTTGNSMVNAGASSVPMGSMDFAGSSAAGSSGGGLMDFGSSFGSTGSSTVAPGTAAAGTPSTGTFGAGGSLGGGWASAAGGALSGYMAGRENYANDPNMWNQKDNFGTAHKDYRAEVGGGVLGGVMGYYGGPVGAALAGPTVKAVHPYAEKGTRAVINFGDKVGGAGGALMLDPIGTTASGKYSWGDLGKGALLGPAGKWLGW